MDAKKMPVISIIIATLNSQKTLAKALQSVQGQNYPQDKIEILVIDGGSTDATLDIARQFGCKIIDNPETEPGNAKYLGFLVAKGDYAIFLDSDEVFENKQSILLKVRTLRHNPHVKAAIGSGYITPPGYPFINDYINEFGDPFSFFIYRLSKNNNIFVELMRKRYKILSNDDDAVIFDLSDANPLPLIELVAAGSIVDLTYLKNNFPDLMVNKRLTVHMFYLIMSKNPFIAITKCDALIHYSSDSLNKYLNKIRSRIKNNIHFAEGLGMVGYSGRAKFGSPIWRLKKYLFIPYALTLVFPTIDALYLIFSRKKIGYALHLPLCLFTASQIMFQFTLKIFGITPAARSYGESKIIRQ
jgi:glycosyltransferase involved in cell wall biosynthesis